MDTTPLFFFLFSIFIISTYTYTAISTPICQSAMCGGSVIQFPFRLREQTHRCGYPGFDISCKKGTQPVLNLPLSGDFMVTEIDYSTQSVYLNDPYNCLPKRILSLNLSGSQFNGPFSRSFTFLNCTSYDVSIYPVMPIGCLSGDNYTVVAGDSVLIPTSLPPTCRNITTVWVPVQMYFYRPWGPMDLNEDLQLMWNEPSCGACARDGGTCGFKSGSVKEIGCSRSSKGEKMVPNLDLILLALLHGSFIFAVLLVVIFIILICLLLAFAITFFSIILIDFYDVFSTISWCFDTLQANLRLGFVLVLFTIMQFVVNLSLASKPSFEQALSIARVKAQHAMDQLKDLKLAISIKL